MMRKIVLSLVLAGTVGACASAPAVVNNVPGAPDWFENPDSNLLCGYGQEVNRGNPGLTRDAGISAARVDLARQMSTKVEAMLKRYAADGAAEGKEFSEANTTQVTREITQMDISGSRVKRQTFVDKNFYAMVCLDLAGFKDLIDQSKAMGARAKEALKARSDAEFADLDSQLKRLDNK